MIGSTNHTINEKNVLKSSFVIVKTTVVIQIKFYQVWKIGVLRAAVILLTLQK